MKVGGGYFLYMAEAEGRTELVNTREARVNAVIKKMKWHIDKGHDPQRYIDAVLADYNLTQEGLTEKELKKIEGSVKRYIVKKRGY